MDTHPWRRELAVRTVGDGEAEEGDALFLTLFIVRMVVWGFEWIVFHASSVLIHTLLLVALISLATSGRCLGWDPGRGHSASGREADKTWRVRAYRADRPKGLASTGTEVWARNLW